MPDNSERRRRQQELNIRVIMGNPPYAVSQHIDYPHLDGRIAETYAARSSATLKTKLYDSYIRAIRWGADRLGESGVLAYVTNGGWVDANTADGMRKSIIDEFASIYIFHLRGNARTSGEQRRKESGNIFGEGSRAPIVISVFVKNPSAKQQGRIFFHDIGDYLSREDKLKIVASFRSVLGIRVKSGWQQIVPDNHGDWLKQRDDSVADYIGIGDKKDQQAPALFESYSLGVATGRDAWCFNSSRMRLGRAIEHSINHYNSRLAEFVRARAADRTLAPEPYMASSPGDLSWTANLRTAFAREETLNIYEGTFVTATYRPFFQQHLYFSRQLINRVGLFPRLFPEQGTSNRVISLSSTGSRAGLSTLMTDNIVSLHIASMDGSQCFPLTLYARADTDADDDLFSMVEDAKPTYRTRHGITDAGLAYFQAAYPGETITKDDIFYYTYGLLHSEDYRRRFADNLTKELPRIPCVKQAADFWAFVQAGRALGDLHVGYETIEPYPVTLKQGDLSLASIDDSVKFFRVEKMAFGKGKDRSVIHYNPNITLIDVPLEAYDYVVNGKPAIDWVMERQAVKVDKDSGIVNDANDYANETVGDPRYPFDLLCRVITVSLETMKSVRALPPLEI
ncbi:type ISP restriction/modification enzyme [Tabrizicola sp.]|uniref:type ISP restriction/modification enzyme n=1 Tax=Tabrizicola sp. TaxID=2005166 RepID=UPI0035B4695B